MADFDNVKKIDYLTEDDPIPRQNWVCISFISPEGLMNCSVRGIKIRGIYATETEAKERADYLQQIDPDFNIFVGEVGKWLPWDPDPNSQGDQVYREEKLNEIVAAKKKEDLMKAKIADERKRNLMNKVKSGNKQGKNTGREKNIEKIKDRMNKKLQERKNKESNRFKLQEDSLKREEDELNEKRKQINAKEKEVLSLNDKLSKMSDLCKSINNC